MREPLAQSERKRNFQTFLTVFLLILVSFAGIHYMIYLGLTRTFDSSLHRNLAAALFISGYLCIPLGFIASRFKSKIFYFVSWFGYVWLGSFMILFSLFLVDFLVFIFYPDLSSYVWWALAGVLILKSLYNGYQKPRFIEHRLSNNSLSGLKLVQISDLHIGMLHLNEDWLNSVVERINDQKPDILVVTGDLVEGSFNQVSPVLDVLKKTSTIPHRFYITGNHEYIHGGAVWENKLQQIGFEVLHNENRILNYKNSLLMVAGVPDKMVKRFQKSEVSLPDTALKSERKVDYKILLAHQPSSVFDIKNETCDLMLSGHTHGGQIFPFHFLVRTVQPVVAGFKKINNILVYAHQGTGFWGPPMRLLTRSEIAVFTWN